MCVCVRECVCVCVSVCECVFVCMCNCVCLCVFVCLSLILTYDGLWCRHPFGMVCVSFVCVCVCVCLCVLEYDADIAWLCTVEQQWCVWCVCVLMCIAVWCRYSKLLPCSGPPLWTYSQASRMNHNHYHTMQSLKMRLNVFL